jgi:hypothetical protein
MNLSNLHLILLVSAWILMWWAGSEILGRYRGSRTRGALENKAPSRSESTGSDRSLCRVRTGRCRWCVRRLVVARSNSWQPPSPRRLHTASRDARAGPHGLLNATSSSSPARPPPSAATPSKPLPHASFYPHPAHSGTRHVASEPIGPTDQCLGVDKRIPFPFAPARLRRPLSSPVQRVQAVAAWPPDELITRAPRAHHHTGSRHPDMWTRLSGPHTSWRALMAPLLRLAACPVGSGDHMRRAGLGLPRWRGHASRRDWAEGLRRRPFF